MRRPWDFAKRPQALLVDSPATGPARPACRHARCAEEDAQQDEACQRQSVAARSVAMQRAGTFGMGGQPPCRRDAPVRRAESDRSGQTIAPKSRTVKIDFQNVNTTLMNPATRASTRPLKLS